VTGSAAAEPRLRRLPALAPTALFAALAAYTVARAALRFPYSDDFDLAVDKTPGWAWLWAQHNEHRIPLPKLLLVACARHGDFRVGVWLSLALMTAAAAWLVVRLGRRLDGGARLAVCVLVPAVLLNPANNAWRWDVELQFVTCAALVLVAFVHALDARRAGDAILFAVASLLLPLTGGNGLVLSGATIAAALVLARDRGLAAPTRAIFVAGAVLTLAVDLAYLHGYHAPAQHDAFRAGSLAQLADVAAHLAVAPLGSLAERAAVPVAIVLGIVAAAIAVAVSAARTPRRLVLAIFFAGNLAVLVAIAWARAGRGWIVGLEAHYASLVAPAYCVGIVAFASTAIAARARRAVLVVGALAAAMCLAYVPTATPETRRLEHAFIADRGAGVGSDELVARYLRLFYYVDTPESRAVVARYLRR
jgi:hypothetical protein